MIVGTPERALWSAHVIQTLDDAAGLFSYSFTVRRVDRESLDVQYERIRKDIQRRINKFGKVPFQFNRHETERARTYMELGRYDKAVEFAGLDSLFVNKSFQLIKEVIKLENLLMDEFKDHLVSENEYLRLRRDEKCGQLRLV